jgi:RHS repeat-associated protein
MVYDPSKQLTIYYNYLNLPERFEFEDCRVIEITYDAAGTKLKQELSNGQRMITSRAYVGGIEYNNGFLEAIYHAEGRTYFENGTSRQEFNLSDHLGNRRLAYSDLDGNGRIDMTTDPETNEVLDEQNYYPFGMEMAGNWLEDKGRASNYRFNGKEFNEDIGLYAYGYRYYDPAIGRFIGVDPIADQFPHVSTYNYAENDPIVNIDLHGLQKVNVNVIGMMSRSDGSTFAVAGEAQLDIGNQNRVDYKLFTNDGNGISGSFSQSDGFGTAASNFGPSNYDEAFFKADRPGGIVVPGFGLGMGLDAARNALAPGSQEEADLLSDEEKILNSQINFVLNSVQEMYDAGILTPLYDRDGSKSEATNSEGETYSRKFTNVYRGSVGDFEFSESGISFKGKVVISYTEQKCTENCND